MFSSPLSVAVGKPYKLDFAQFLGPVWGGTIIALQPAVSIVDRGNNVVSSINSEYYVSVRLSGNPTNTTLFPQDETKLTVPVIGGIASFRDLYIRAAGFPYRLTFSSNTVCIDWHSLIESTTFLLCSKAI